LFAEYTAFCDQIHLSEQGLWSESEIAKKFADAIKPNPKGHVSLRNLDCFSASPSLKRGITTIIVSVSESLSPGKCMTAQAFQEIQETRATVLLRCEELQTHLDDTKQRLNQAADQLEQLTKIMLPEAPSSQEPSARPWLKELAVGQLVDDVAQAERKLAEVRAIAAEIGIPLPPDLK
jgi:hypothetical protein